MPRGKPKRKAPYRSKATDADILAELVKGSGVNETAAKLRTRVERVVRINKKFGSVAQIKKRESAFEALNHAVIALGGLLETVRFTHEADTIKAVALALGISTDKLLNLAGKPNLTTRVEVDQTTTERKIDLTDLVNKLDRAELQQMIMLRDKLNDTPPPPELSDLDSPVVYDDAEELPEGGP